MKYSPQEAYELLGTASETEAARTHRSNLRMNESAETCDPLPPRLTDSESESDSGSEPESELEYAIEKIGIKYQLDSPPNVTINASAGGIGSEKVNHEDDDGLTIVTWNKNKSAVNYDLVSSNDSREMSDN